MIYPHNFEQKIGFDQIRQLLKGKCLSALGEERVDEMTFSDNYDEINQRLEQVVEFVRITQEEEDFPAQYFFDVRPSLKRIRVEGMYMDEQELFDLRRSQETIRDIVRFLQQSDEEEETENSPYPALRELAGDILVFPQLIARIDSILDKFGKIKDNASAELLRIRRELSATTGSIFTQSKQHSPCCTIGRVCRQGCYSHHARRTSGHPGCSGHEAQNQRYCTR